MMLTSEFAPPPRCKVGIPFLNITASFASRVSAEQVLNFPMEG